MSCSALWYGALREQPVRIVYARRWTIEVTFHDQKQFLGFEDPQN
jgi:hypothetical protein